jgi:hypothetical protein
MTDLPKRLSHALWTVTENIVRFQMRLQNASDPIERTMLECTLALEREKLALLEVQTRTFTLGKPSSIDKGQGDPVDRGICKIIGGWGHQDSAWVRYSDSSKLEVPENQYRFAGYEPPFEDLPECKGEQNA